MFAMRCPIPFTCAPVRRKISRTICGYYSLDKRNSQPLDKVDKEGLFHVIAFIRDGDTGLYSVTEKDEDGIPRNNIVAFRNFEDAFRYKTLLEADVKITDWERRSALMRGEWSVKEKDGK